MASIRLYCEGIFLRPLQVTLNEFLSFYSSVIAQQWGLRVQECVQIKMKIFTQNRCQEKNESTRNIQRNNTMFNLRPLRK